MKKWGWREIAIWQRVMYSRQLRKEDGIVSLYASRKRAHYSGFHSRKKNFYSSLQKVENHSIDVLSTNLRGRRVVSRAILLNIGFEATRYQNEICLV